ncbi:MarR family winged helix-turn-helix transcriptional regulator [Saccharopolyspora gloriosae]|uniref:MarR family winged helix-turn-helix transcriptional regulator n=1 Tax=Saccharopolyspora gloriosae TaxID=455344 RepID=UPI001FB80E77|nr:MarR family transcriptional regulator [Saccharopolyspora gloriosae]
MIERIETPADSPATGSGRTEDRERRGAAEAVERELVMMFRRARNFSMTVASQVHPDLDPASYSLLLMVDDAGSLRGMDVADRTGLDKSTVSRQIATLVELDLLERVPDPDDGRARRIQLSASGRSRLAQVRKQRRKHMHGEFAHWSTTDLQDLSRLLSQLNRMF